MKPVLLGMNNPHSVDPARALGVKPAHASGHRLWQMLAISGMVRESPVIVDATAYEAGFNRYNLLDEEVFDPARFTHERRVLTMGRLHNCIVVMCGTNVPRTLGLKHNGFDLKPQDGPGFIYYVIPHPSGLCREYNDMGMRVKVGNLLLMLYLLGVVQ